MNLLIRVDHTPSGPDPNQTNPNSNKVGFRMLFLTSTQFWSNPDQPDQINAPIYKYFGFYKTYKNNYNKMREKKIVKITRVFLLRDEGVIRF